MSATEHDFEGRHPQLRKGILAGVAAVIVAVLAWFCLYTVNEWEQVVIIQFGEVVSDPVTEAGLHFKLPYQQVKRFDARLLRWDGSETTTITRDRKTLNVDVTARWRISDARAFLEAIRSVDQADMRLNGIIAGAVKDEIAKYDLYEVIRSSNRILEGDEADLEIEIEAEEGSDIVMEEVAAFGANLPELPRGEDGAYEAGRPIVLRGVLEEARKRLRQIGLGIELEDVLIKQLNYTQDIEANVYAQMNAELQKISAGFRSQGRRLAEEKLGEMERDLARIKSEAEKRAQIIRGQAEAEAIAIYAEAYNQDLKFYEFLRTLEAYQGTLGGNGRMILSTDGELFRLLEGIGKWQAPDVGDAEGN